MKDELKRVEGHKTLDAVGATIRINNRNVTIGVVPTIENKIRVGYAIQNPKDENNTEILGKIVIGRALKNSSGVFDETTSVSNENLNIYSLKFVLEMVIKSVKTNPSLIPALARLSVNEPIF